MKALISLLNKIRGYRTFQLHCTHCNKILEVNDMVAIEMRPGIVIAHCFKCGSKLKVLSNKEQKLFKPSTWDGDGYIG